MNTFQQKVRMLVLKCVDEIDHKHVKHFTLTALNNAPDYVWTIMASTSGKYHHGELLSEHMLKAFYYGKEHVRMLGWWWDTTTKEVFYSALLLHDLFRNQQSSFFGRAKIDLYLKLFEPQQLFRSPLEIPCG